VLYSPPEPTALRRPWGTPSLAPCGHPSLPRRERADPAPAG
jgi:hypothetical protein